MTGNPFEEPFTEAVAQGLDGGTPAPIPLGRSVVCDYCNEDMTDDPRAGGFTVDGFGGIYAAGPCCAARREASIRACGEERFIRARCPDGTTFADWVRGMRGPQAAIRITPVLHGRAS